MNGETIDWSQAPEDATHGYILDGHSQTGPLTIFLKRTEGGVLMAWLLTGRWYPHPKTNAADNAQARPATRQQDALGLAFPQGHPWAITQQTDENYSNTMRDAIALAEEELKGRAFPCEGYEKLHNVFRDAHDHAAYQKGAERHANGLPFHEQRMQAISEGYDSPLGMAFQVEKKIREGLQMPDYGACRRELLGALNYLAGVVIFLDKKNQ